MTESVPCTASNDDALKHAHLTYHMDLMRKINISKIDTTLAIGFYISDYEEYKYFRAYL